MTDPHTAAVRLLELDAKATAPDWNSLEIGTHNGTGSHVYLIDENGRKIGVLWGKATEKAENMELILHARNHAPAICEALLRMEAALREIAQAHDAGRHDGKPEPCPALDADTMFALATAALSPRTPQADGET